jgi:hypothetical protein
MNASPLEAGRAGWLETARRPEIVGRALRVAAVVGTILVAIHYTDRWLAGSLSRVDLLKIGLTYLVPYCVSTFTAVQIARTSR